MEFESEHNSGLRYNFSGVSELSRFQMDLGSDLSWPQLNADSTLLSFPVNLEDTFPSCGLYFSAFSPHCRQFNY